MYCPSKNKYFGTSEVAFQFWSCKLSLNLGIYLLDLMISLTIHKGSLNLQSQDNMEELGNKLGNGI